MSLSLPTLPSVSYVKLISAAVVVLAIAGTIFFLVQSRNHYKKLYNDDQVSIGVLQDKIKGMTETQNLQIKKTDGTVLTVIQGPEVVKPLVKVIHDAPEPANCVTPPLPEEVKNAF